MVNINWWGEMQLVREDSEGKITCDEPQGENGVSQQLGQAQRRLKIVKDRIYVRMYFLFL